MINPDAPRSLAPWSEDQVASLNAYQVAGCFHEFTCGHLFHIDKVVLVARVDGWWCPLTKEIVQKWAHPFMLDWSWSTMDWLGRKWDKEHGKWA